NIPYKMVGGHKFYDRKEIKDILAYLQVIANPADSLSLLRIINVPKRGVGAGSIEKLQSFAALHDFSLLEAGQNVALSSLKGKAATEIEKLAQSLADFNQMIPYLSVTELTREVLEKTGYEDELKRQNNLESQNRLENLEEFLS
ncbi:3'-5' exonuclease, partial [Enterococcus sp. S86.2]